MAEVKLPVRSSNWRTFSSKNIMPEWTGQWIVDIADEDGTVIYSLPFTVKQVHGVRRDSSDTEAFGSLEAGCGVLIQEAQTGYEQVVHENFDDGWPGYEEPTITFHYLQAAKLG